jgi:hypothetical protein
MSLSDLASIGSFVSGVAVLASLIYLALQVRQNTHAHRVTAHQDRLTFLRDFLGRIADPSVAAVYLRGLSADGALTEVEFTRYRALMHSWFLGMAEIVWLHERGVLDEDRFAGSMEALRGYLSFPGCRAVWPIIKPVMPVTFQGLVEKIIAGTQERSAHAAFETWQSAVEGAGAPR